MAEVTVTGKNFEQEITKSEIPVLVDFWATWCGPCRMVAPILADIAEEYEGKIKVCKINVDENPDLASKFSIFAIPTIIGFVDGQPKAKVEGAVPKENILALLK